MCDSAPRRKTVLLDNTFIGSDEQGGDSGSMRFLSKKRTAEPGVREFAPSAVVCLGTLAMVIVALTAVLTGGCGQKDSANGAPNTPPGGTPVQVQVVKAVTIADSTEYLSVMKSRHSANINPQVEGQITKIFVKSGDRVKAGQQLLQIDPLKQQAAVSSQEAARVAQEANLQLAKVSYERSRRLLEAGGIAKAEFDSAQSNYESAAAELKSLEEQVNTQRAERHYYGVTARIGGSGG